MGAKKTPKQKEPRKNQQFINQTRPKIKERTPLIDRLPKLPPFVLLFALLWAFASWLYADVFYIAEQFSFFVFDKEQMKFILDQPFGTFAAAGRCALLLFHYPILGGFVWALTLSLAAWLAAYTIGLHGRWRVLAAFIPCAFTGWLLARGFNLYYLREPSVIFSVPLVAVIILALTALLRRVVARKATFSQTNKDRWIQNGVILLLMGGLCFYAISPNQNLRLTCKMQRQMQQQDWIGMIETAQKSKQPTRSVAAYYAIALIQTDQLCDRLFDIHYQYADMKTTDRADHFDSGTNYYQADCSFYAGLLYPAYHYAMERTVADGPSCYQLKRLTQSALLNGENNLVHKYLAILSRVPFENDFVQRISAQIDNTEAIKADAEYAQVLSRVPMNNAFEQQFRQPIFLGYNVAVVQGRSMRALQASLAACLYAKQMPDFVLRTQPLANSTLPKVVDEAITMQSMKNKQLQQVFPRNEFQLSLFKSFLQVATPLVKDRERGAEQLYAQYGNYYPYYYYFENLPDETTKKDHEGDKQGVN